MEGAADGSFQETGDIQRRAAIPGMKKKDGTYIPAIVPPQWEE